MNLPTKTGKYAMPAEVVAAYRRLHPTADDEFARMVIWLHSNEPRRPASPKSAPRFVANWFKRVPRIAAARQDARIATIAALTGRSDTNVIELRAAATAVGGAHLRQNDRNVWRAEDVCDVDWREPGASESDMGAGARALPAPGASRSGGSNAR